MKSIAGLITTTVILLFLASCSLFQPPEMEPQHLAEHRIGTSTGITQGQISDPALVSWFDIPFAQPPLALSLIHISEPTRRS